MISILLLILYKIVFRLNLNVHMKPIINLFQSKNVRIDLMPNLCCDIFYKMYLNFQENMFVNCHE